MSKCLHHIAYFLPCPIHVPNFVCYCLFPTLSDSCLKGCIRLFIPYPALFMSDGLHSIVYSLPTLFMFPILHSFALSTFFQRSLVSGNCFTFFFVMNISLVNLVLSGNRETNSTLDRIYKIFRNKFVL